MFLSTEITAENMQLAWINIAVLGVIILIGCISSKRFNFLHGFIATVSLMFFVTGVAVAISENMLAGLQDPTAHWIYSFYSQYTKYIGLVAYLPTQIVDLVKLSFPNVEFIQQAGNYWMLFFAPVALWLVSSIFAHMFRKRR